MDENKIYSLMETAWGEAAGFFLGLGLPLGVTVLAVWLTEPWRHSGKLAFFTCLFTGVVLAVVGGQNADRSRFYCGLMTGAGYSLLFLYFLLGGLFKGTWHFV